MLSKQKWSAASCLLVMALVLIGGRAQSVAGQPPDQRRPFGFLKAEPLKAAKGDDELLKLSKERYNTALEVAKGYLYRAKVDPNFTWNQIQDAAKKLLIAELELSEKPADQIAAYEKNLVLARESEEVAKQFLEGGQGTPLDVANARYYRLTAEIELLKAKRKAMPPKK